MTVPDQPAEQSAFFERALRAEAALAVDDVDKVTRLEFVGSPPPPSGHHAMIRGEPDFVSFLGTEPEDLLYARLEDR